MILQTAASLLNIGGRRLGLVPERRRVERDLEQVRDAIDGVRALLPILERHSPPQLRPLRDALSQLQMAYTREVQAEAAAAAGRDSRADASSAPLPAAQPAGSTPKQPPTPKPAEGSPVPGPAESSGRLWVPGR